MKTTATKSGKGGQSLKNGLLRSVCAFAAVLVISAPVPAHATCESFITAQIGVIAVKTLNSTALKGLEKGVKAGEKATLVLTNQIGSAAIDRMDVKTRERMDEFWKDFKEALQGLTKQLSSTNVDMERQTSNGQDTAGLTMTARTVQRAEQEAKKQYQVTDQGCRFDTAAKHLSANSRKASAMSAGVTTQVDQILANKKGSPGASGPAAFQKKRWQTYVDTFCNPANNAGDAGCTTAGAAPDADVLPSRTLFGNYTIDMDDPVSRAAVTSLTYNLVGFDVPPPMNPKTLTTPAGKEQVLKNRAYITQMDAVGALVSSIVGERTKGEKAPEIEKMRKKIGMGNASEYPSEKEVLQSTIEQLWDPNYFADLLDSPSTVTQKEVYLQAYNLMMLYKVIEKTEKISNVYALQTANMLDRLDKSRGNDMQVSPLRTP